MAREVSYGIIPLRYRNQTWQVLIIQHHAGHWAFPKGHPEKGETSQQTAERELFEETGLKTVRLLSLNGLRENYFFMMKGERISKTVEYFAAEVKGKLNLQKSEIKAGKWFSLSEAENQMTFPEGKRLCLEVKNFLNL